MRRALFVFSLLLGVSSMAATQPQRLRPPASLTCSRDHLTSFQGRVLEYKREPQEIFLRVRTDEDTTEMFTLKWSSSERAETWFLLLGEQFKSGDWSRIESSSGKLHDGIRIIVWACDDGSKPVFDWRPNA